MNFFESVFADDPQISEDEPHHPKSEDDQVSSDDELDRSSSDDQQSGAWSFGGLLKSIASTSDSVIQNYRQDLKEFGSSLRMETAVIREAATRAVKELPASLEVGAAVAQESLESVGQAIDDLGSKAVEIMSHGKDSILAVDDDERHSSSDSDSRIRLKKYSRFEAQLRGMQCDVKTYCQEVEDLDDFGKWKLGFEVGEKGGEIMDLIGENEAMEGLYRQLVPKELDHETFWSRYFYRVNKLKLVEEARVKLVKRVLGGADEEDLSWDFDDGDDSVAIQETADQCDPRKDSNFSVLSTQQVHPPSLHVGDELGWDEIGDLGSYDECETKRSGSGSPDKIDLYKRLSATERDEDLSWDIEEDDEPVRH